MGSYKTVVQRNTETLKFLVSLWQPRTAPSYESDLEIVPGGIFWPPNLITITQLGVINLNVWECIVQA